MVRRLIPLANGQQMIVATLYGYTKASAHADDYVANERLMAAALVRMKSMGAIP